MEDVVANVLDEMTGLVAMVVDMKTNAPTTTRDPTHPNPREIYEDTEEDGDDEDASAARDTGKAASTPSENYKRIAAEPPRVPVTQNPASAHKEEGVFDAAGAGESNDTAEDVSEANVVLSTVTGDASITAVSPSPYEDGEGVSSNERIHDGATVYANAEETSPPAHLEHGVASNEDALIPSTDAASPSEVTIVDCADEHGAVNELHAEAENDVDSAGNVDENAGEIEHDAENAGDPEHDTENAGDPEHSTAEGNPDVGYNEDEGVVEAENGANLHDPLQTPQLLPSCTKDEISALLAGNVEYIPITCKEDLERLQQRLCALHDNLKRKNVNPFQDPELAILVSTTIAHIAGYIDRHSPDALYEDDDDIATFRANYEKVVNIVRRFAANGNRFKKGEKGQRQESDARKRPSGGLKFAGEPQNLLAAFATSKNDKFFKALDGYFALDPMDERGGSQGEPMLMSEGHAVVAEAVQAAAVARVLEWAPIDGSRLCGAPIAWEVIAFLYWIANEFFLGQTGTPDAEPTTATTTYEMEDGDDDMASDDGEVANDDDTNALGGIDLRAVKATKYLTEREAKWIRDNFKKILLHPMGKILRRLFSPTSELYRIFLKEDEKPLFYVDDKIKKKLEEVPSFTTEIRKQLFAVWAQIRSNIPNPPAPSASSKSPAALKRTSKNVKNGGAGKQIAAVAPNNAQIPDTCSLPPPASVAVAPPPTGTNPRKRAGKKVDTGAAAELSKSAPSKSTPPESAAGLAVHSGHFNAVQVGVFSPQPEGADSQGGASAAGNVKAAKPRSHKKHNPQIQPLLPLPAPATVASDQLPSPPASKRRRTDADASDACEGPIDKTSESPVTFELAAGQASSEQTLFSLDADLFLPAMDHAGIPLPVEMDEPTVRHPEVDPEALDRLMSLDDDPDDPGDVFPRNQADTRTEGPAADPQPPRLPPHGESSHVPDVLDPYLYAELFADFNKPPSEVDIQHLPGPGIKPTPHGMIRDLSEDPFK